MVRGGGHGAPAGVARDQQGRELVADGGFGGRGILSGPGSFDDLGGKGTAHVAADQQLLDRIPVGHCRAALQQAAQARHEAAASLLQALGQVAGSLVGRR